MNRFWQMLHTFGLQMPSSNDFIMILQGFASRNQNKILCQGIAFSHISTYGRKQNQTRYPSGNIFVRPAYQATCGATYGHWPCSPYRRVCNSFTKTDIGSGAGNLSTHTHTHTSACRLFGRHPARRPQGDPAAESENNIYRIQDPRQCIFGILCLTVCFFAYILNV